jgi:hypothetical protein
MALVVAAWLLVKWEQFDPKLEQGGTKAAHPSPFNPLEQSSRKEQQKEGI